MLFLTAISGKKPFDEGLLGSSAPPVGVTGRRGSIGSTGKLKCLIDIIINNFWFAFF